MDIPPKIIYGNDDNVRQGLEVALQKYFDISRHYFEFDPLSMIEPQVLLRESFKFYRYKFPVNISEYFFRYEEAPLIWICESPLNKYLKEFYGHHFPVLNGVDQYKSVKEIYNKWFTNKYHDEKKYFAASIIDFVDNNNSRSNFLSNIFAGVVLLYEKALFNPQKAVELFEKSKEIISKIKLSNASKAELDYLVTLFSGYSFLIQGENETAKDKFEGALKLKPSGITAKFHLAIADIRLQGIESSENQIKEIYNYDTERINFAIENLSSNLFSYFINNAVFYNIFYYPEFSSFHEKIETFLSLIKISNEPRIKILTNKFEVFNQVIEKKIFTAEIDRSISFIEKVLNKHKDSNNIHFLNAAVKLENMFLETVTEIQANIRNKYYNEIEEKITPINKEIQLRSSSVDKLKSELEGRKLELKDKLTSGIKSIDQKILEETHMLEDEINNLPLKSKLNPQTAFKHAMTYNIILSFIVFLMGGCAGYSNNFVHNVSELKNLISISLITGTKWGVITFLIGIIISALSALFTALERSNRRQNLLQSINRLKNEKEYRINHLKKDIAQREVVLINNYDVQIMENKERIEQLIEEKESKESSLKAEVDQLIEEECKPNAFILDEEG